MAQSAINPWYSSWFGSDYLKLYPHRNSAEATMQAEFISALLNLTDRDKLLDIACGEGRHLAAFRRKGISVFGIDLSNHLLTRAAATALPVLQADMRQLPFANQQFSILCSLFTSFGYFDSDEQHLALLTEWSRVAVYGAHLVLDYLNPDYTVANLIPTTVEQIEHNLVTQTRAISKEGSRVQKTIEFFNTQTKQAITYTESVMLYSLAELTSLLRAANFEVVSTYSGYSRESFSETSERLLLIAQRV